MPQSRTRSGFASRILVTFFTVVGAALISIGAVSAQDGSDQCIGPDGLPIIPIDGEPCPGGGAGFGLCSCDPTLAPFCSSDTSFCLASQTKMCGNSFPYVYPLA